MSEFRHDADTDERQDTDSGPSTRFVRWTDVAGGVDRDEVAESPPDANVILISHPEDQLLGRRWHLRNGVRIDIGRSPSCDISLPDTLSVSRRHARLCFEQKQVDLEDLGSTNGTYVNDQRLSGAVTLKSGDRFQVGSVHFKFLQEYDVENAYYQTLYQLAVRDGLTEIYNKRKFDEELEREFLRAGRYERPLSLILFDLDHFKQVNDSHGHLCGDHVLKEVARLVAQHLRPEQTFARVGGEEFAILSPESSAEGAVRLAEKLRRRLAATDYEFAGVELGVTCSFGVAARAGGARTAMALYEAADQALYRAKSTGRNRTVVATPA